LNYSIIQALYTLQFLRFGILFPLVPLFAEQIGAGPSMIGFIVGMFSLLAFFLAIPMGRLVDRYGIKRLLGLGVFCNIVGGGVLLGTDTVGELFLVQTISGLAFLLHVIGCQAYISNLKAHARVEKGFGHLSLWAAIGQSLGPFMGGLLVAHSGYPTAFIACLAVSLMGLVVLGFREDRSAYEASNRQSGASQLHQMARLMADPKIICVLMFTFAVIYAVNLRSSFLPVFLRTQRMSEGWIGLIIGFLPLMAILARLFFVRLCALFDRKPLVLLSLAAVGLGSALVPVFSSITGLSIAALLIGLGFGVTQPLSMLILSESRPPGTAGLAMGVRLTVIMLATLVSPVVSGLAVRVFGLESAFFAAAMIVAGTGGVILLRFK
jgi:MFS family permease